MHSTGETLTGSLVSPSQEEILQPGIHARGTVFLILVSCFFLFTSAHVPAQAALLIEQPYGFFGRLNPTGHDAIYFQRICAETPVKLRRCQPGELGAVISRYQGIADYDWVAIPLIPYLYSVENISEVPARVDPATVNQLRNRYHDEHLTGLGADIPEGNLVRGGWTQLVGTVYERRVFVFRFATTEAQDEALINRLNAVPNRSHFNLIFNNCADFARKVLKSYLRHSFRRGIFPDAGITTPKEVAYELVRFAQKHPEIQLTVAEIPQIPGYRSKSRANKSVNESLTTTLYAVPIALVNPYLAGVLFGDYLVRGRHHILPKHPPVINPNDMTAWALQPLTEPDTTAQNPLSVGVQATGATASSTNTTASETPSQGLQEEVSSHE